MDFLTKKNYRNLSAKKVPHGQFFFFWVEQENLIFFAKNWFLFQKVQIFSYFVEKVNFYFLY